MTTTLRLNRIVVPAVLALVLLAIVPVRATGRDREVAVAWGGLQAAVGSAVVSLVLPEGAIVEGTVAEVRDDALLLRVKKTSDKRFKRDATATIPRSSVRVLQTRETRGSWRALGALIGAGGGAVAGWALAEGVFHTSGEGSGTWSEPEGPTLILGLGAAAAAAGYLAGRSKDRLVTIYRIVP